jgi:hypothetical protein
VPTQLGLTDYRRDEQLGRAIEFVEAVVDMVSTRVQIHEAPEYYDSGGAVE